MSRSDQYDELDEMTISAADAKKAELEDDIRIGGQQKPKKQKPGEKPKTPYQLQKEAQQRRARNRMILIIGALFLVILGALIAVGVAFSQDVPEVVQKAVRDETRGYFLNTKNLPEMDPAGVRGMIKEAYFTTDGDLAVTINLSNGTTSEHEVVRLVATVVNADQEIVAKQTFEGAQFLKTFKVPAGGRSEMYVEIDEKNVLLPEDTLGALGSTFEIGSKPTDGKMPTTQPNGAVVGDGPKDVANGRQYYENLGNMPDFSADGLKATIVRARYTNDGSLVLDFSVSNGTATAQTLSSLNLMMKNGAGELITEYTFTDLTAQGHVIAAQSYDEVQLIVDTAHVQLKNDTLETLTTSVTVSGVAAS